MQNIILLMICVIIPLSLADIKMKLDNFHTRELDTIKMFDGDKYNNEINRKSDTGYFYPRPNRPIKFQSIHLSRGSERYATRFPTNIVKPFKRYGPPKQKSLHDIVNNRQTLRSQSQRHKNKYHNYNSNGNDIRFPDSNVPNDNAQLNIPNSNTGSNHLSQSNPIASQNEVPFNHNTAHYLPPKNQKLPIYLSEPSQQFNINSQNQLHNSRLQTQQLSDAAQFLTQNAQAISQLYEKPATNLNYEPITNDFNESTNDNNKFKRFNTITSNQQSQLRQNSAITTGKLLSYSPDTLETNRALEKLIADEKDRLIVQLQQALTTQHQSSVSHVTNNNPENYYDKQKLLDSNVKFYNLGDHNAIDNTNNALRQMSFQFNTPVTSYGTPVNTVHDQTPSAVSLTSSTLSNNIPIHHQSQTTDIAHVPTLISTPNKESNVAQSYFQYENFIPTSIAATNILNGLSTNYDSTFINKHPSNTPTHFNIETTFNNKPILGSTLSNTVIVKPTFPSISSSSSADHSVSLPIPSNHPIPISPIHHSLLPINPTAIPLQKPIVISHPSYAIQPNLINHAIIKPIKPIYPLYYYSNTIYQSQKPTVSLSTSPWNYASSHWHTKSNQTWK